MPRLLSIITPSRRQHQLAELLENLRATVADPTSIELIVKVDWDDIPSINFINAQKGAWPFQIKVLSTPRLAGLFTLWVPLDEAIQLADPESYFIWFVTDELRCETVGWDRVLSRYVAVFPDHIFRLRISNNKFANYSDPFTCLIKPENFAIFTRRWLVATEGLGDCKGSDAQHQLISFYLGMGLHDYRDIWRRDAHWREIAVLDMEFSGIDYAFDIPESERLTRNARENRELNRMNQYHKQLECNYLAKRLFLCIVAHQIGIHRFQLVKNEACRTVQLLDLDRVAVAREVSYSLPHLPIVIGNLRRKARLAASVWMDDLAGIVEAIRNHDLVGRAAFALGLPSLPDGTATPVAGPPEAGRPAFWTRIALGLVEVLRRLSNGGAHLGKAVLRAARRSRLGGARGRLWATCPPGLESPVADPPWGWLGLKWLLYPFSIAARTARLGYPLPHADEVAYLPALIERARRAFRDAEFAAEEPRASPTRSDGVAGR